MPQTTPEPPVKLSDVLAWPLIGFVHLYRLVLSPIFGMLGAQCRFQPTCSAYALAALRNTGAFWGSVHALRRIGRCHPWHPGGEDPPPEPARNGS